MSIFRPSTQSHWVFLDQCLVSGVNFITTILIARSLGVDEYGRFLILWMLVLFANSLQMALVVLPMMNIAPKQPSETLPSYYGVVYTHQLIWMLVSVGILCGLLLIGQGFFPNLSLTSLVFPFCLVYFSTQLQDFVRRYCFTQRLPSVALMTDGVSYLGQLVLLAAVFLTIKKPDVATIWLCMAISSLLAAVSVLPWLHRPVFDLDQFACVTKRHWQFAKWEMLSTLAIWGGANFLVVLTGMLLGTVQVGLFGAFQNLFGITNILFLGLANLVPPRLAGQLTHAPLTQAESYLMRVALWGMAALGILCLPIILFPDALMKLLYGAHYTGYTSLVYAFVALQGINLLMQLLNILLNALEFPKVTFISFIVATLVGWLFAIPLIQTYGLAGTLAGILLIGVIRLAIMGGAYLKIRQTYTSTALS